MPLRAALAQGVVRPTPQMAPRGRQTMSCSTTAQESKGSRGAGTRAEYAEQHHGELVGVRERGGAASPSCANCNGYGRAIGVKSMPASTPDEELAAPKVTLALDGEQSDRGSPVVRKAYTPVAMQSPLLVAFWSCC
ncbi:hypothetical protein EV715DRAFT_264881 [Schizophyllum commune]